MPQDLWCWLFLFFHGVIGLDLSLQESLASCPAGSSLSCTSLIQFKSHTVKRAPRVSAPNSDPHTQNDQNAVDAENDAPEHIEAAEAPPPSTGSPRPEAHAQHMPYVMHQTLLSLSFWEHEVAATAWPVAQKVASDALRRLSTLAVDCHARLQREPQAFTIIVVALVVLMTVALGTFVHFIYMHQQDDGPSPPQQEVRTRALKQPPSSRPSGGTPMQSQRSSRGSARGDSALLCPELVVPDGTECVLAVPVVSGPVMEAVSSFGVCDKKGKALLNVAVDVSPSSEAPAGHAFERIMLMSSKSNGGHLAYCELLIPMNRSATASTRCMVFKQEGNLFARLDMIAKSTTPNGEYEHYMLKGASGGWQLDFYGSLVDRTFNVTNDQSQLLATAEQSDFSFGRGGQYYQLRVAPLADAGLILCALLALDRMVIR